MANANSAPIETSSTPPLSSSTEDAALKAVNKRYEGLVNVRTKAIKGKGAWYWAHLEPILVRNPETNLPKAVKLKCTLCDATFSASNPSRTASEHLKRGTCPNFSSSLKPIASDLPSPMPPLASPSSHSHRKRSAQQTGTSSSSYQVHGIADSSRFRGDMGYSPAQFAQTHGGMTNAGLNQRHFMLSGGKEDLGALAILEDNVKKLKSPKASPGPNLSKDQVASAFDFLADWFFESCGSVSFSSLEHPKFRAFLQQVGLPAVSRRDFCGATLDSKFERARMESEARIRDAMFFQVASDGWMSKNCGRGGEENLIKFMVNLPNGTSVFQKATFIGGSVPSQYAEEVLSETIRGICGNVVQRCVGIVADKYKSKALRNLEIQNNWMINFSCQLQAFISLIKDFCKDLPLFKTVSDSCFKIADFFNSRPQFRDNFHFRSQEFGFVGLFRVPSPKSGNSKNFSPVFAMLEDILGCARVLQFVVLDDTYKVVLLEDPVAREVSEIIQDVGFWNDLEAAHSLVKLIRGMAEEIEAERPLIGQCLPLWEELRAKVKEWCSKFSISEGLVEKIVERRFRRNYHPAWSAAYILDPLYLMKDASGKYLPPFKCLTHEQEKDVDKLVTRLVSREEAHIALMELMKWRSEGLDPLYAQAVQVKQQDPLTGKLKIANPQSSRLVWETCLKEFKSLGKVAVRLLFLHASSCGFKCNWPFTRWVCVQGHSRVGLDRAEKMIYIAAHAKLDKRDYSCDEDKDAELFAITSGDDMLNEVFADAPSV